MRLISEDVRSIRGALLFVYVIIEEEPFQAPPEPGASCQAGSCRRVDRHLSISNGRREIAGGIINICRIAVKLRARSGSTKNRVPGQWPAPNRWWNSDPLDRAARFADPGATVLRRNDKPWPQLTRNQPTPAAHRETRRPTGFAMQVRS